MGKKRAFGGGQKYNAAKTGMRNVRTALSRNCSGAGADARHAPQVLVQLHQAAGDKVAPSYIQWY